MILLTITAIILVGWLFNGNVNGFGFVLRGLNGFITTLVIFFILKKCGENFDTVLRDILFLLLFFMLLEFVTRFFLPSYLGAYVSDDKFRQVSNMLSSGEGAFYFLKILSYLRFDSNGVGVIAFLSFGLSVFACKLNVVSRLFPIVFFMLVCFTLSRAAIAVSIVFYLFSNNYRSLFFIVPLFFISLVISLPFFIYGGSGESKFEVILNLGTYLDYVDIYNLILGQGIAADIFDSQITGVNGFFGHNLFVFIIFYLGYFALIPYLFFIFPLGSVNRYSMLFFLSILVIGMSYLRPFESFVFILFPFIYLLSTRLSYEKM
ncbi:hypothetical protein BCU61_015615 [Vibrio splendidus]|uniref:hypothetical protein n=1 Tax=Vibrio splendidus TaxID=29497 RepID=UPI0010564007|nr:hypothetical protein [Vibrio splendidus]